jgi:GNAT superfamily N-acetyltransferase
MTHPEFKGEGVGAWITQYARQEAAERGLRGVRLDCWIGQPRLQQRWEELGFTYLRTRPLPGRRSGVLMEMRF